MEKTKYILPTLGVGKSEREQHDFYATNPKTVKLFLEKIQEDGIIIPNKILEPACGAGHISEVLKEYGKEVISRDKYNQGYGKIGIDFLETTEKFDCIFTNPPYKYELDFAKKAIECTNRNGLVIFLLKIQFLETKSRSYFLKNFPPKYVYVHVIRQTCARNGDFENTKHGAMTFAWFIWQKGFFGEPVVRWID